MSYIIPSAILATYSLAVLIFLYLLLFIQYRERYLGLWTLSWLINLLGPLFLLFASEGKYPNAILVLDQVPSLFSGLLLLWGACVFYKKPLSKWWVCGSLLSVIWLFTGLLCQFSFLMLTVPVFTYLGLLYARTGLMFLINREVEGVGRNITGWSLIIWGIHRADFPFLRTVQWFAPFGYFFASVLTLLVAIGIMLVFFQKTRKELADSEARYRAIVEDQTELICRYTPEGIVTFVNDAVIRYLGKKREEIIGSSFFSYLPAEDREIVKERLKSYTRENPVITADNFVLLPNGEIRWQQWTNRAIFDDRGAFIEFQSVGRDITDRKRMEDELKESEERYRLYIETSPNAIAVTDLDGTIIMVNGQIAKLWGSENKDEIIGKNAFEFVAPQDRERIQKKAKELLNEVIHRKNEGIYRNIEYTLLRKDGSQYPGELSASVILDNSGNPKGFMVVITDVTERKRTQDQLKYLSLHDPLTGFYNRTYFEEETRRMENGRHDPVGIIICDVDGLKLVNDTYGHGAGDALLVAAAGVIKSSFRESDMVARIGGDEFAILLPNSDEKTVEEACNRIRKAITRYNEKRPKILLGISIGFAAKSDKLKDMAELFKEADNNMYREKIIHNQSARSALVQSFRQVLTAKGFISEGDTQRLHALTLGLARDASLPEDKIEDLNLLVQFHDIGKIGVPEKILSKPGPLTAEEYSEVKKHCEIGNLIAVSPPELNPIADLILKHHEWWNGEGYPLGLKGEDIPLECRILAIAEAYDAMTSERPYRKTLTHEEAVRELERCAGTQFDPFLVKQFINLLENKRQGGLFKNTKASALS